MELRVNTAWVAAWARRPVSFFPIHQSGCRHCLSLMSQMRMLSVTVKPGLEQLGQAAAWLMGMPRTGEQAPDVGGVFPLFLCPFPTCASYPACLGAAAGFHLVTVAEPCAHLLTTPPLVVGDCRQYLPEYGRRNEGETSLLELGVAAVCSGRGPSRHFPHAETSDDALNAQLEAGDSHIPPENHAGGLVDDSGALGVLLVPTGFLSYSATS